jgi:hypothetical protein
LDPAETGDSTAVVEEDAMALVRPIPPAPLSGRALSTLIGGVLLALTPAEGGAQTCGLTSCAIPQICFQGDGVLVSGVLCFHFEEAGGSVVASLDDTGGYPAGTNVHVEGCLESIDAGVCPLEGVDLHLSGNTIEALPPPPVPALASGARFFVAVLVAGLGATALCARRRRR